MPRKKPLPESEKQIGRRVAAIRMLAHLNQVEAANLIGATPGIIANVEAGRAPLRSILALKICRQLKVNPQWLATGEGLPILKGVLSGETSRPDMLFSDYFSQYLSGQFYHLSYDEESAIRGARQRLKSEQRKHSKSPDSAGAGMISALKRVINEWEQDRDKKTALAALMGKNELTETANENRSAEVKLLLPNLLKRINEQTAEPGKKSELAKFLGAPLASVSRWLSGAREPGGEITLKMLHWVEQQERK